MKIRAFDRLDRKFWHLYLPWLAAAAITSCASPTSPAHSTEPKCQAEEWNGTAWVWVEVDCKSANDTVNSLRAE